MQRIRENNFYRILVVGLVIHLYKAVKDVARDFVLARSGGVVQFSLASG